MYCQAVLCEAESSAKNHPVPLLELRGRKLGGSQLTPVSMHSCVECGNWQNKPQSQAFGEVVCQVCGGCG